MCRLSPDGPKRVTIHHCSFVSRSLNPNHILRGMAAMAESTTIAQTDSCDPATSLESTQGKGIDRISDVPLDILCEVRHPISLPLQVLIT